MRHHGNVETPAGCHISPWVIPVPCIKANCSWSVPPQLPVNSRLTAHSFTRWHDNGRRPDPTVSLLRLDIVKYQKDRGLTDISQTAINTSTRLYLQ
jgi:hypothetical protein